MAVRKLAVFADLGEDIRLELEPVLSELGLATVSARDDVEVLRLVDGTFALVRTRARRKRALSRKRASSWSSGSPKNSSAPARRAANLLSRPFFRPDENDGKVPRRLVLTEAGTEFAPLARLGEDEARPLSTRRSKPASPTHVTKVDNRRCLYESTVAQVNQVLGQIKDDRRPAISALRERAVPLVESMEGSEEMVAFALGARGANDLATHHVNVAILGLAIARELELPQQDLERFAFLGLVHDLGMARIPESILGAPRRLMREEFRTITEHPGHTREILRQAGSQYHDIAEIAYQEHEREMGQGYPLGLRGEQIDELAKIVGVADVYEACTHARTYRKIFIPYEALQELIEMRGDFFHQRYIKALMNAVTVYPLGSYVQLNTGEKGRVLATNRKNLMRPTMELLWNARGGRLGSPKTVDLSESPFLFVSKPLSEELLPRSERES